MLELMATCRISTAMHHSQREKLPERGGKTTPSACQSRPWGTLRSGAGRGRSRCRWAALAPALPGRTVGEAVCSEPDGLLCEGVSLGVLGIPLGCSPSLQGAQHPSGPNHAIASHPAPRDCLLRVCIPAAPLFLPLLSGGLFISLSIYFFYLFLAVERLKSVVPH